MPDEIQVETPPPRALQSGLVPFVDRGDGWFEITLADGRRFRVREPEFGRCPYCESITYRHECRPVQG